MRSLPHLLTTLSGLLLFTTAAHAATSSDFQQQLLQSSYSGIYQEDVKLNNGYYAGAPFDEGGASRPTVTLIDELIAYGDLNGDGQQDAAVLLLENSGGSGDFIYLAAVVNDNGNARNVATRLVGDRVQFRNLEITSGNITADTIAQDAGESYAQPSLKKHLLYQLQGDKLVQLSSESQGNLSAADLEGTSWKQQGEQQTPAPESHTGEITAIFKDGKISGSSACNRYSASLEDHGKGRITTGPAISTRMACPPPLMEQESAYLNFLSKVEGFRFSFGKLVLFTAEHQDSRRFAAMPAETSQ